MIPKLHYISQGETPKEHLENIQKACTSGAELVQLQLNNSADKQTNGEDKKLLSFAKEARKITAHFQTRLIISSDYNLAKEIKADGVYLKKTDSCPTVARKHLHNWQIIGSEANTIQDCEILLDKHVNYIALGPFKTSKTNTAPLGIKGYTAITDILKTGTPIIGFGGITTKDVSLVLKAGISGLAISEAITHDFSTIKVFNTLLIASSTAEQRYSIK